MSGGAVAGQRPAGACKGRPIRSPRPLSLVYLASNAQLIYWPSWNHAAILRLRWRLRRFCVPLESGRSLLLGAAVTSLTPAAGVDGRPRGGQGLRPGAHEDARRRRGRRSAEAHGGRIRRGRPRGRRRGGCGLLLGAAPHEAPQDGRRERRVESAAPGLERLAQREATAARRGRRRRQLRGRQALAGLATQLHVHGGRSRGRGRREPAEAGLGDKITKERRGA